MRKSISTFILLSVLSVGQLVAARPRSTNAPPRRRTPQPRRTTSLFINPPALPDLPTVQAVDKLDDALDIDNIQSDILVGMKKTKELFFFFGVEDAATFKSKLASDILPLITTTTEILSTDTQPITAVNIAFSHTGLVALGVNDDIGDTDFVSGQFSEATTVGDRPTLWDPAFAGTKIHGVFLLASNTTEDINTELANIQSILGSSITEIHRLQGAARPGAEEGHEHFGFLDGISQPAVNGFTDTVLPGQTPVDPGLFLLGESGDPSQDSRPSWAVDGSFLVFRQLQQFVPEFNQFLADHPLDIPGRTAEEGSELLGARMVGRWKSGAPVFLSPTQDDPVLGADKNRNNDFNYLVASDPDPGTENHFNQTACPFGAHIRKVHPRGDLSPSAENPHFIIRSSIPYGPEVTDAEAASSTTSVDRGLAFVSYQSNIFNGFVFLQSIWINNVNFIFGKVDPTIGVDPIIGTLGGGPHNISGLNPLIPVNETVDFQDDPWNDVVIPRDFVVSHGGEYFFSPSLSGISAIAAA
uniref:Dye-decolorizing peroxidase n=1 Tax=Mycena epipterygia TaxID=230806 RepID=DYP_MYCEP|nr:RecName: Full=Dye-decolorizing peroxidase; Short=MepDyP; Flags: Precursor [Mycena epipterygia]AFJ79725.1 dye-decolorizing peroxidase precursor [Mycena epipterygia]